MKEQKIEITLAKKEDIDTLILSLVYLGFKVRKTFHVEQVFPITTIYFSK